MNDVLVFHLTDTNATSAQCQSAFAVRENRVGGTRYSDGSFSLAGDDGNRYRLSLVGVPGGWSWGVFKIVDGAVTL